MRKLAIAVALLCALGGATSAQVSPIPFVKPTYLDNNGRPCSGCKLYSYIAGTSTPQATYSDPSGTFPNANPTILDAAGRANIYLSAFGYKLVLQSSAGSTIWTVDKVVVSAIALLSSNNVWTGTNTWNASAIFNSSATFNTGFTSTGPNVLNGGGTLNGTYLGSPIFSGTPNLSGGFVATTGSFSGKITSTLVTGTAPFAIASTTVVPNLNVSQLLGCTWSVPCPIGSTTPSTGAFTTLTVSTSLVLNAPTTGTGVQGTGSKLLSSGTNSGVTGKILCNDATAAATDTCALGFSKIQVVKKVGSNCATGGGSNVNCLDTLTWPSAFVDTAYIAVCSGVDPNAYDGGVGATNHNEVLTIDAYTANTITVITTSNRSLTAQYTEIHCIGMHP